jgi:hypothetical protein
MVNNKEDNRVREIFDYLLKIAAYDKSLIIRQKVRILSQLFDCENYDAVFSKSIE